MSELGTPRKYDWADAESDEEEVQPRKEKSTSPVEEDSAEREAFGE